MSSRSVSCTGLLSVVFAAHFCLGQKTSAPANSEKTDSSRFDAEARQLVGDILAQAPTRETTFEGVLKIRDAHGKRTEVPLKYVILPEPGGWRGLYETRSTPWRGAERVMIIHRDNQPNEYVHSAAGGPGVGAQ